MRKLRRNKRCKHRDATKSFRRLGSVGSLNSMSITRQPVRSETLSPHDLPSVFYKSADGASVVSVKKRRSIFYRVRGFLRSDD